MNDSPNQYEESGFTAAGRGLGDLAHDALTLVELQLELVKLDSKKAVRKAVLPVVLALAGVVLLLGCASIALAAFAYLLFAKTALSQAAAFGVSALTGVLVGTVLLWSAWVLIRKSVHVFARSSDEFTRSVHWLKDVLRDPAVRRSSNNRDRMSASPLH